MIKCIRYFNITSFLKMETTSNVSGADKGMEYQYKVAAYILVYLLNNSSIKDYVIYANVKDAGKFDDIIMKIWFASDRYPHIYAIQVKHRTDKPLNISCNQNKYNISTYLDTYKDTIKKRNEIPYLGDVPEENIKFWLFCSDDLEDIDVCKGENVLFTCNWNKLIYADMTIIPMETTVGSCYKLFSKKPGQYKKFFDKFYLFLHQPKNEEIGEEIKRISGLNDQIAKYVEKFFKTTELCQEGLTKKIFEMEFLLLKLSTYMPNLTATVDINPKHAHIWNKITLEHDVTVVSKIANADGILYECCLQKVNELFAQNVDWKHYLRPHAQFDDGITKKFIDFAAGQPFRHWLTEPRTLQCLLQELWIYDEVPLILETDTDLSILAQFKYLRKKYIIISNISKMHLELNPFYSDAFTNISDIYNRQLRQELLHNISVSLQGRKPMSLQSILGEDKNSIAAFTCGDLLKLMKKRNVYLGGNFKDEAESMIFIIEDADSPDYCPDTQHVSTEGQKNIVITCRNIKEVRRHFHKRIEEDKDFINYSLCCLTLTNKKFKYLEGDINRLRYFFVDEDENDIYNVDEEEPVLIIGQRISRKIQFYIPRYLSKSKVLESVLDMQKKQIFFVTGDVDSLDSNIKDRIIEYPIDKDTDIDLEIDSVVFIKIKGSIDVYWTKFSSENYQLIYVKAVDGCFILVEHRNCTKMILHTSYNRNEFKEEHFAKEIDNKVIILNGESGIGKSALLQSLVETSDGQNYVLFCNLTELGDELRFGKKLLESPLDFLFNKYETSSLKALLDPIFKYHKDSGRLTIFIDSFDEMLPLAICKDTALAFIKCIAESGVNVIVASALVSSNLMMNNLLMNNIKVQPVRINYLKVNDSEIYFKRKGVFDFSVDKIPQELLLNPLHLSFIQFYHERGTLDFACIDKFDLCTKIIMKRIEKYYRSINQSYVLEEDESNEALNDDVLDIHRCMALTQMFGTHFVMKYVTDRYDKSMKEFADIKIRLGIVKAFKNDCPIFMNRIFVEYLVKQWLVKSELDELESSIFIANYNKNAEHFFISSEDLKPEEGSESDGSEL